jgi:tRNA-splicing ligase RtcB
VGTDQNHKLTSSVNNWEGWMDWKNLSQDEKRYKEADLWKKAQHQLGSLGGGNHFVEICLEDQGDEKGDAVWVMLHSGSRGVGNILAQRHIEIAKGLMKEMFITLPDRELSYLAEGSPQFEAYFADLMWCQAYALQNRKEMMARALKDLSYAMHHDFRPIEIEMEVNCHHNYVEREHHYGENVLVTRKGAVLAREGVYGIIPGSMGTKSYIVKGKGNPESFHSCSHGAGRRMSRGAAKQKFTVEDLKTQTKGVECRKDSGVIDEIPGAYKDIDKVMERQSDLVEIVAELKQVMCIKG